MGTDTDNELIDTVVRAIRSTTTDEDRPSDARGVVPRGDRLPFTPDEMRAFRDDFKRFLVEYQSGLREVETKVGNLREEFLHVSDYNPIEHVSSRVKSIESILGKAARKGIPLNLAAIREKMTDIAGVRVTCSFIDDAYRLFDLLTHQDDLTLRCVKDYIAAPKPNGYKSLHAIVDVPVYLSSGRVRVPVEIQFRTIAMDFWASLEHKIYYKYESNVPIQLLQDLKDAAHSAAELDMRMQQLHQQVHGSRQGPLRPIAS